MQVPLKCGAIEDVYIIENINPRTTALNQMMGLIKASL